MGSKMGIYDRDWWRERYNKRTDHDEKKDSAWRRPASETDTRQSFQHVPHNPKNRPPDLPGVEWHWTVKLVAFGLVMTVLLVAAKHLGPLLR